MNLVGSKIGLLICIEDGPYYPFCAFDHIDGGTLTNTTEQCVTRYQPGGVLERVLHCIRHRPRSLADEVRIQLLALKNLSGDKIPSILVPLGNPGADTRAQRTN